MIRKTQLHFLLILSVCIYTSCESESSKLRSQQAQYDAKIEAIENKLAQKDEFINLLNDELNTINNSLNEIDSEENYLNPVDKITLFDSILIQNENKIRDLENLAAKRTSNADSRLLNSIISDLTEKLKEKEIEINKLRVQNDSLFFVSTVKADSIKSLSLVLEDIRKEQKELRLDKAAFEDKMKAENEKLESEKQKIQEELNIANEKLKEETRNNYFDIALEYLSEFENTSDGFLQKGKKKMRGTLLNNSYSYFRKACLLDHPTAYKYISKIINSKPYNEYLDIKDRRNFRLTNCGI